MNEFDRIETPENVELERRLAGIGSRMIAGITDYLILIVAFLTVYFIGLFTLGIGFLSDFGGSVGFALLIIGGFLVHWGYFVVFEILTNGQSPGKKAAKIRIVQEEGRPLTLQSVAIRNLLRAVDGIGGYVVAGLCMFLTRKCQRLGDLAAGTVAVSEEIIDYSARSDHKRGVVREQEVTGAALEATMLKPEELRALRNYWLRKEQFKEETRARILPKILQPILRRTGNPLAVGAPTLESLEEYVADTLHRAIRAEEAEEKAVAEASRSSNNPWGTP